LTNGLRDKSLNSGIATQLGKKRMRTTILILTIIGYVILLTLQLGKGGLLYCQSCLASCTSVAGVVPGCDCEKAESRELRAAAGKETTKALFSAIPFAAGIFGAVHAFNCLGRGQPGLFGGIFLLASVLIFLVIWLLYDGLGGNFYLNLPLIFPLIAGVIAVFLKPTEPIPTTEPDPSDPPEDEK
jgi:hypothetical protein